MNPPSAQKLPWWWVLGFAVPPVLFAAVHLGRWHPDEVFQYLEPAYRRVHGYGVVAWEWQVGLRNWASPEILSWFLRLADALGIKDPRGYRLVLAVPMLGLHVGLLAAAFRYVERRTAVRGPATYFAFALVACLGSVLIFSGRTMGEPISTALLVMAADRLDRSGQLLRRDRVIDALLGGALLGLSVVARYGSAVFVLAALIWLLASRRFVTLALCCASGLVIALGLGLLDHLTWGAPFHSLRAYIDFNLVSGRAAQQFGEHPWWFYLPLIAIWIAPWAWPGTVASVIKERWLPLPAWMAAVYAIAISTTAHKEERFLYPAMVLFALGAAPGVAGWIFAITRPRVQRGVAAAALVSGLLCLFKAPPFNGDEFHAFIRATRSESATGIHIVGEGLWGSGGQFYLGKNIPIYNGDLPGQIHAVLTRDRRVNRVITIRAAGREAIEANGFVETGIVGRWHIFERRP